MAQMHIDMSLDEIISKVQRMTIDREAKSIVESQDYGIFTVTWEDCARYKQSVWGPCISDMTLQVGDSRMPVIRKNNYVDKTWDIKIDQIPIVVGNEKKKRNNKDKDSDNNNNSKDKTDNDIEIDDEKKADNNNNNNNANNDNNEQEGMVGELKTITLKEYLKNFDQYMTNKPKNGKKINLLKTNELQDSHVIVSSQACFLPIEKGGETKFNVSLFNYESTFDNPGVLAIVATSKGTSSQIIRGNGDEKLLFNDFGIKSDFLGQRLTDNRIERGIKDLNAPMTIKEKQDNCILIIQIPLKQKKISQRRSHSWNYESYDNYDLDECCDMMDDIREESHFMMDDCCESLDNIVEKSCDISNSSRKFSKKSRRLERSSNMMHSFYKSFTSSVSSNNNNNNKSNSNSMSSLSQMNKQTLEISKDNEDDSYDDGSSDDECNIEPAMVKVAPKTCPQCICGFELKPIEKYIDYNQLKNTKCNQCSQDINIKWICPNENKHYLHKRGFYLCDKCCVEQLSFDELKGLTIDKLVRDDTYPIRMTLQFYKSTDNGKITSKIMKQISKQLKSSQKNANFVGSLVTDYDANRPTEWVKQDNINNNNNNNNNNNIILENNSNVNNNNNNGNNGNNDDAQQNGKKKNNENIVSSTWNYVVSKSSALYEKFS